MKPTPTTILLFFAAFAAITTGYTVSNPADFIDENVGLRDILTEPARAFPIVQANPQAATASLNTFFYLERDEAVPPPALHAPVAFVQTADGKRTFLARQSSELRPIASITKLMTALIVLDTTSASELVTISPSAVATIGTTGGLIAGERMTVEALLHAMLLESSNDAAVALAEHVGQFGISSSNSALAVGKFVSLMNQKAASLGLRRTVFADPVGLSNQTMSTAEDISRLASYLRSNTAYRSIWQILKKPTIEFSSADGRAHVFVNNNPFIGARSGIIGGKTGFTESAGESMVMLAESPDRTAELVYVVLGSTDRFDDMQTLINWIGSAFVWQTSPSR